MLNRIKTIFVEITGKTDVVITEKTKLDESLGMSSLSVIQLICALEDEFDIDIPNTEIKKFKTVNDIIRFLDKNAVNK
jgi:acyl carrier protein